MAERPYKFGFAWRRPAIVRVTAADPHWGFVLNRYPGVVIGLALYLGHWGLSLLWGRPSRVIYTEQDRDGTPAAPAQPTQERPLSLILFILSLILTVIGIVRRQLSSALNSTFETYDPLLSLKGGDRAQVTTLADLAKDATTKLAAALPAGVLVRSLLIPKITFDESIQAKINQYLAALAETQIAEQRQKTAQAQKTANDLLAVANSTPAVLYQNCLDMVERLTRDGKVLPAAFTCGPGPTVVVPVK